MRRLPSSFCLLVVLALSLMTSAAEARKPRSETELRGWLENMIWHHRFTLDEVRQATGLSLEEIRAAVDRFGLEAKTGSARAAGAPLRMLPYPGGRHPRIGFLDGAIEPQRETKLSIFTPWDDTSYVVADVPEAIWSNLGLTYLAHSHIDTLWTKEGVVLPPLEWERLANGDLRQERTLPNGMRFGTLARATPEAVLLRMWLSNGTARALSDLRVQNCVMLKGAVGFNAQTNSNKVLRAPFAACRSESGDRWVITAWKPIQRAWANPPVPCIHADPQFPDTAPGETSEMFGLVAFYAGADIEAEFRRLEARWDDLLRPLRRSD
jgi:hypothetical protein